MGNRKNPNWVNEFQIDGCFSIYNYNTTQKLPALINFMIC